MGDLGLFVSLPKHDQEAVPSMVFITETCFRSGKDQQWRSAEALLHVGAARLPDRLRSTRHEDRL